MTEVIVLGLGAMGSAAAAQLAGRGRDVLGIEQFTPAHDRGSSHGETRLIRQAYYEDARYVPLLLRSYELWAELEDEFPGTRTLTGGLMLGTASSPTVAGTIASAEQWGLEHDVLRAADLRARFPMLAVDDDTVGVYERLGGYVVPERTVRAQLDRAAARGAELHFGERALGWRADGDGVEVVTDRATYRADRLVVSAGAWAPDVLPDLPAPLQVERQLLFWFQPRGGVEVFRAPGFPVFLWEDRDGMQLYGFPAYGGPDDGVKVAFFRHGTPAHPDALERRVAPDEVEFMRAYLAERIPDLGVALRAAACMYTTSPDENFVVAPHPGHPAVVVAAGFSGHGFKFAPVIGEILADLAESGATRHDIAMFDPARFGAAVSP